MSSRALRHLTPEEYLEIERKAEHKSEYLDGQMYAMAGASINHSRIISNVSATLWTQLPGSECSVFTMDLRLSIRASGLFTYPDVMVICGPVETAAGGNDVVANPKLIVEVLSNSTKNYDRGEKFRHYRSIPGFSEYLLVAQDNPRVEQHVRQADGSWVFREFTTQGADILLPSIGCSLNTKTIYEGVDFAAN